MTRLLITTTERSLLAVSAPSTDEITRAFQAARIGVDGSHWVGPSPRITRRASPPWFYTTASWVYEWPDSIRVVPRQALLDSVARQLRTWSSDWEPPTGYTYDPAVHGSLASWQSGQMTVTRTRNDFPTEFGRFDAPENPTGPTTAETHPSTAAQVTRDAARVVGEAVGETASQVKKAELDILMPVLGAVGVLAVVYLLVTHAPTPTPPRRPPSQPLADDHEEPDDFDGDDFDTDERE